MDQLRKFIGAHRERLEEALARHLPISAEPGTECLNRALRYALFPGGKRLRPMLTLVGVAAMRGPTERALPIACAIEYLHTSSLILDDLPAMDDANERRGRKALHLVVGEGIAILAALALLNRAYGLMARAGDGKGALLVAEAARSIGVEGMISGQATDLSVSAETACAATLASRNLKTTSLMRLSLGASAILCDAPDGVRAALNRFAECLGAAYQMGDDLADGMETGKSVGQDLRLRRPSFALQGDRREIKERACSLIEEAKSAVQAALGEQSPLLVDFAEYVKGKILR
jgi:geranylgeranyl diphosphate synthase type II